MFKIILIVLLIGFSTIVRADTCRNLLQKSKDPALNELVKRVIGVFDTLDINPINTNDGQTLFNQIRKDIDALLKTNRPQDIPLDMLDRIARRKLVFASEYPTTKQHSVFTAKQQKMAVRLLAQQALSEEQIETVIKKTRNDIEETLKRIQDKQKDVSFKTPQLWDPLTSGILDYDLMILKHILYTSPEFLTSDLLIFMSNAFMSDFVNAPHISTSRDAAYAHDRVLELLEARSAVRDFEVNPEDIQTEFDSDESVN